MIFKELLDIRNYLIHAYFGDFLDFTLVAKHCVLLLGRVSVLHMTSAAILSMNCTSNLLLLYLRQECMFYICNWIYYNKFIGIKNMLINSLILGQANLILTRHGPLINQIDLKSNNIFQCIDSPPYFARGEVGTPSPASDDITNL